MDAEGIRQLEPQLVEFLDRFGDCFRGATREPIFPCMCGASFLSCHGKAWSPWRWQQALRCEPCKSS